MKICDTCGRVESYSHISGNRVKIKKYLDWQNKMPFHFCSDTCLGRAKKDLKTNFTEA
jgi:hypothetical protein